MYVEDCDHRSLPVLPQDTSAEKFEESPIIFGDYLKMGAAKSDRIYEELSDMRKTSNILLEVHTCMYMLCSSSPLICSSYLVSGRLQHELS